MAKTPAPTFEVRFVAPGLAPEKIPFRAVSEALGAIQDLASGRDPFETRQVPPEKLIGLLQVRRGSAVYSCVSRDPDEARRNLRLVGKMLSGLDGKYKEGDLMVSAFRPIETLSTVARTIGCRLEVYPAAKHEPPIFTIEEGDFEKLSSRLLLTGDATVLGTIVRVGGATGMRCLLRVPHRKRSQASAPARAAPLRTDRGCWNSDMDSPFMAYLRIQHPELHATEARGPYKDDCEAP